MTQDFVMAALAMQRAVELDGDEPQWRVERDRLLLCVSDQVSSLLQVRTLICAGLWDVSLPQNIQVLLG